MTTELATIFIKWNYCIAESWEFSPGQNFSKVTSRVVVHKKYARALTFESVWQEGDKLLRRIPEIDLVMGPQYANRISDLLEDVINGNQVVATEAVRIIHFLL